MLSPGSPRSARWRISRPMSSRCGRQLDPIAARIEAVPEPQFEVARRPVVRLEAPMERRAAFSSKSSSVICRAGGRGTCFRPAAPARSGRHGLSRCAALTSPLIAASISVSPSWRPAGKAIAQVDHQPRLVDPVVLRDDVGAVEDVVERRQHIHVLAEAGGIQARSCSGAAPR